MFLGLNNMHMRMPFCVSDIPEKEEKNLQGFDFPGG